MEKDEFLRGYLIAVSNLVMLHGVSSEAEDLLKELGDIDKKDIERLNLTEMDINNINEVRNQK